MQQNQECCWSLSKLNYLIWKLVFNRRGGKKRSCTNRGNKCRLVSSGTSEWTRWLRSPLSEALWENLGFECTHSQTENQSFGKLTRGTWCKDGEEQITEIRRRGRGEGAEDERWRLKKYKNVKRFLRRRSDKRINTGKIWQEKLNKKTVEEWGDAKQRRKKKKRWAWIINTKKLLWKVGKGATMRRNNPSKVKK